MRIQILASGSEGNSTLVRAGETSLLVDAGLLRLEQERRIEAARLAPGAIDHVLVTHGHLDHARSAGAIARRDRAILHCPEGMMLHPAARRAKRLAALHIGGTVELRGVRAGEGEGPVRVATVPLPHDCDPTVGFRLEHEGRVVAVLTDLGRPDEHVARALAGAHVLVLEFNYDPGLMAAGPYPRELQRRITAGRGHLSNAQGAAMLALLAGDELHTLVVAHVSRKTNRADLAEAAARDELARLGLAHVRVVVAQQHEVGGEIEV